MKFTEKVKKEIKETIEKYCEGITFLEFSADDLPDIISDIETVITDNEANKTFSEGVVVEIIACTRGHEFEIGEKVTLVEYDDEMWVAENSDGKQWYIGEHEAVVC